jgi:hypothetical protein
LDPIETPVQSLIKRSDPETRGWVLPETTRPST